MSDESGFRRVTAMIHVTDVRATADWYVSIGFRLLRVKEEDGVLSWALLACGETQIMLNGGGKPSDAFRREVDLYVAVDDLDVVRRRLAGRAEVVEDVHDTEYGMRELIARDPNRFWITFGQPIG